MRHDEAELFSRLRTRLRAAITEQSSNLGSKDPSQLAGEIQRDMVEPELRKIKARLRASEKVLTRKSVVGLALESLVTTCGMHAGG